jgi:hypothetical protein
MQLIDLVTFRIELGLGRLLLAWPTTHTGLMAGFNSHAFVSSHMQHPLLRL